MLLLGQSPGLVGVYEGGGVLPVSVEIGGEFGVPAFAGAKKWRAIVSGFDLGAEDGLSVRHTLRSRVYVYLVGGPRVHPVTVSGLIFPAVCNGDEVASGGIGQVFSYYEKYRASAQPWPVRIYVDPLLVLRGFLYKMRISLADAEFGLAQFSFEFVAPPRVTPGATLLQQAALARQAAAVQPALAGLTGGLSIATTAGTEAVLAGAGASVQLSQIQGAQ